MQIGAELLCKGGKVDDKTGRGGAGQITEYRVQITDFGGEESVNAKVQTRAELLCKGGKVGDRGRIT